MNAQRRLRPAFRAHCTSAHRDGIYRDGATMSAINSAIVGLTPDNGPGLTYPLGYLRDFAMSTLTIGKLVQAAEVGIDTVRFCERAGLLKKPPARLQAIGSMLNQMRRVCGSFAAPSTRVLSGRGCRVTAS